MTQADATTDTRNEPWVMTRPDLERVIADDQGRSHRTAVSLATVSVVASAGLTVLATVIDRQSYGVPIASMLIVAAFLLVAAIVAPLTLSAMHRARTRRWKQRQRECEELAAIAGKIKDPALGKLISFNFRLMDRFVAVAIEQARTSYLTCLMAATAALLVLLVGTTTVLTIRSTTGQVTAGVLTAVGAALGSYLSVTFLRTFQMTSKQMSYYYGQPLVHCYLLHAEWLGERFEEDADPVNRWEIRHRLIRAALGASHNAQNHLLDLQLDVQRTAPIGPDPGEDSAPPYLPTPASAGVDAHRRR